ncbi:hypothetical protein C2845_PM05G18340 [Panicum miliaceum]|uniref:Uncharacterized protein n=1 Tax=Panicum miliaceum TaxID=4540 RepID=A0A3L6T1K4_PANMI|nr:hypothetical protein C2845_PM05G18340 [Panicum miliaceum]
MGAWRAAAPPVEAANTGAARREAGDLCQHRRCSGGDEAGGTQRRASGGTRRAGPATGGRTTRRGGQRPTLLGAEAGGRRPTLLGRDPATMEQLGFTCLSVGSMVTQLTYLHSLCEKKRKGF